VEEEGATAKPKKGHCQQNNSSGFSLTQHRHNHG